MAGENGGWILNRSPWNASRSARAGRAGHQPVTRCQMSWISGGVFVVRVLSMTW